MKNKKLLCTWLIACLMLCVSIGVFAVSIINFNIGGNINFIADNVYAKVNGKMEGGVQNKTYPELKFENGVNTDLSGWLNTPMEFNESGSNITITITIENLATDRPLYARITDNYGEVQNITKTMRHNGSIYTSASPVTLVASTGDKTSVSTFVFVYQITNKNLSIADGSLWGYNVMLSNSADDITGTISAGLPLKSGYVSESFNSTTESQNFSKVVPNCVVANSDIEFDDDGAGIALINFEVSNFGVDTEVKYAIDNIRAYDHNDNLLELDENDLVFANINGQKFNNTEEVVAYLENTGAQLETYYTNPRVTIVATKNTTAYATVAIGIANWNIYYIAFDLTVTKQQDSLQSIPYDFAYTYNAGIVNIIGGKSLNKNQPKLVLNDNIDFAMSEDVVVNIDIKQVNPEALMYLGMKDYLMLMAKSEKELLNIYDEMGVSGIFESCPYAPLLDTNYLISLQIMLLMDVAGGESEVLPIVKAPLTVEMGEGETYTFLPENWLSDLMILMPLMESLDQATIEQYMPYFINVNDPEIIVPLHLFEINYPLAYLQDNSTITMMLYFLQNTINDTIVDFSSSYLYTVLQKGLASPSEYGLSEDWNFIDIIELVINSIKNDVDLPDVSAMLESGVEFITFKNSVLLPNQATKTDVILPSEMEILQSGYYIFDEVQYNSISYANCKLGAVNAKKYSSTLSEVACVDGVIYTSDRKTLVAYPAYKEATEYTPLSTTTAISDYAFFGSKTLQTLNFNSALASIEANSLQMSNIATINTTTDFISGNFDMMASCLRGTNVDTVFAYGGVYIPREKSVELELKGDVSLEVIYKDNVSNLSFAQSGSTYQVVGSTTDLATVVIPDYFAPSGGAELPVTAIASGVFQNKTTLAEIYIPNSLKTIGANAFNGCTSLTVLDLGSANITSIGTGNLTSDMEIYTKSETTLQTIRGLNANTISVDLDFIIERYDTGTNGQPGNSPSNHFTYTLTIGGKSYVYDYDYYLSMNGVLNSTLVILPQTSGNLEVTLTTSLTANAEYSAGIKGIQEQISLSKKETNGSYTQVFGSSTDETAFNEYDTSSVSSSYPKTGTSTVATGSTLRLRIYYTIMEQAQCFTENTLVTLADGSTKKIKDVGYDDLLMTYDFDRGEFSVSYPAWIATPGEYGCYYLMEFDDGSELEIVLSHRLFNITNMDYNKSIDADFTSIGKTFLKQVMVNGQPKLTTVKCTNITKIEKTVTYYNMVTSQHLNFFSNGFIGATGIANMYTFDKVDDQTYVHNQQQLEFTKSGTTDDATGTMFSYDRFNKDIIPYYIYVSYRIGEIRNMVNILSKVAPYKDLPLAVVEQYAIDLVNDYFVDGYKDEAVQMPSTFKVTYSDNSTQERYAEGESVTLVQPVNTANFAGWYNTFDGKLYQPGQTATIYMNTHFIARYN